MRHLDVLYDDRQGGDALTDAETQLDTDGWSTPAAQPADQKA
jgi:hypothetical protein